MTHGILASEGLMLLGPVLCSCFIGISAENQELIYIGPRVGLPELPLYSISGRIKATCWLYVIHCTFALSLRSVSINRC